MFTTLITKTHVVETLENIELDDDKVLKSFDVIAFLTAFSSVLEKEVVQMAVNRATEDPTWSTRIQMIPDEFRSLLRMTVDTTYFRFKGIIYKQTLGVVMGSPFSSRLVSKGCTCYSPHPLGSGLGMLMILESSTRRHTRENFFTKFNLTNITTALLSSYNKKR